MWHIVWNICISHIFLGPCCFTTSTRKTSRWFGWYMGVPPFFLTPPFKNYMLLALVLDNLLLVQYPFVLKIMKHHTTHRPTILRWTLLTSSEVYRWRSSGCLEPLITQLLTRQPNQSRKNEHQNHPSHGRSFQDPKTHGHPFLETLCIIKAGHSTAG